MVVMFTKVAFTMMKKRKFQGNEAILIAVKGVSTNERSLEKEPNATARLVEMRDLVLPASSVLTSGFKTCTTIPPPPPHPRVKGHKGSKGNKGGKTPGETDKAQTTVFLYSGFQIKGGHVHQGRFFKSRGKDCTRETKSYSPR